MPHLLVVAMPTPSGKQARTRVEVIDKIVAKIILAQVGELSRSPKIRDIFN
jgi:hypothetical protein